MDKLTRLVLTQKRRCYYCGQSFGLGLRMATKDHKLPRSRGGGSAMSNLAAACARCNTAKGSLTEDEFRAVRDDAEALKEATRKINARMQIEAAAMLAGSLADVEGPWQQ